MSRHKASSVVEIRYMEPADTQALFCMENDQTIWPFSTVSDAPYTIQQIEHFVLTSPRSIDSDGQLRFIITRSGSFVGAIDLYDYSSLQRMAWVAIVVYPSIFRGQGVGRAALDKLIARSVAMGLVELRVEIRSNNVTSIEFFRKAGFTTCSDRATDTSSDTIIMRLDLLLDCAAHISLGARGEAAACQYLENQGYKILERNWRAPIQDFRSGEIDIIATKDDALYFVEVKSRSNGCVSGEFSPVAALTPSKIERLSVITSHYLTLSGFDGEVFHALVSVNIPSNRPMEIRYYPVQF
ncbi:MAG: YraN family protein [Mucinivorans sp.]